MTVAISCVSAWACRGDAMKKIDQVTAMEILDSRGDPTVWACVTLESGAKGCAAVPSGASTGIHEALELRDGNPERFGGRGVEKAVHHVASVIAPALRDLEEVSWGSVDDRLIALDGTPDKHRLGANALLAVSLATAHAFAAESCLPLYRYLGGDAADTLPIPMMNILNGGAHAANNVDIQEFMILPVGAGSFREALRWGSEIYHALGSRLRKQGLLSGVGDEGGFAPDLQDDEAALALIMEAVVDAGFDGTQVKLALDAASSAWYSDGTYHLPKRGQTLDREAMVRRWETLCRTYPIVSLEDGMGEEDWEGWRRLTEVLGDKILLVGDDLFVTHTARLMQGIAQHCGNAILIKPNQVGTLTETLAVMAMADDHHVATILSHRSGETDDTTIADLAVAAHAPLIKAGAPCRMERVAKYNRLLMIESELGTRGRYAAFPHPGQG